jgi:hypothetical protein
MLQDGGMPGSARPREFLDYVSRLYPKPRDVRSLLEAVEIAPDTRAPIRRLSGGQQRRISWAAAMVGNPRSLLLDEPTASIDPVGRERLYDVLRAERDQGVSMIVATHLIEDVESLADHIVVVRDGRVALTGTPDELRPRNTLIVRSTREMDATALLSALPSGSTCQRTGPDSYHVDVPTGIDPAVMATVSSWCGQHSVPPDLSVGDLRSVLVERSSRRSQVSTPMIAEMSARPWLDSCRVHARWVLRTTWRNGEQLLLLVGIPLAALLAITQTDLLSTSTPPVVITTVMVVLAAGFTSPAISLAFERRYGSFAFLGTTPLPRSAIIAGSLMQSR